MSGLRNQKNKLRSFIYDMRDELISGIEDKSIDEESEAVIQQDVRCVPGI